MNVSSVSQGGDVGCEKILIGRKDKGWYLVCVGRLSAGIGKLANQTLKNKYLPGWRWQS